MFTHACGGQRLSVFFNHFQPYFLRRGAPLNLEIASSARNGCKKASGVLLPRPSTGLQESVSDARVRDQTWIRMLAQQALYQPRHLPRLPTCVSCVTVQVGMLACVYTCGGRSRLYACYMCTHLYMYMQKLEINFKSLYCSHLFICLSFEAGYLVESRAHYFSWAGYQAPDIPLPVLELQTHRLLYGSQEPKLRSLASQSNHVTH